MTTDNPSDKTDTAETQDNAPLTRADLQSFLSKELGNIVNSAVSSHLKREAKKASKTTVTTESNEDTEQDAGTEKTPEQRKLERHDRELQQIRREREQLKQERLQNQLTNTLKGKVADEWLDVASEKFSQHLTSNKVDLENDPEALPEELGRWLANEKNKRFLPAPKAAVRNSKASSDSHIQVSTPSRDPKDRSFKDRASDAYQDFLKLNSR